MAKMISSSEVSKRMGVFTHDEVKERARYYHTEDKMDEIQLWYDGYLFGDYFGAKAPELSLPQLR